MGKESSLPELLSLQSGCWDSFTGAGRELRETSGSLRMGELGFLCIQTHPALPSIHISSLCLTGEESKGEAGAEVPVQALEQQEAA